MVDQRPSAPWAITAGLGMAATLLVDGVLLWAVISYAVSGRSLVTADWFISAVLVAAMLGASVVLLRLIRGHRPGWLGLPVVLLGLVLPGVIAALFALAGPPFVY
jgi:hypothetical protein